MRKTVWLCHRCHVASEPSEGSSGHWCDVCGGRCTHFITWNSPKEDRAADLLIERELELARGGWCGSDRAKQAMADVEGLRLAFDVRAERR